MIKEKLTCPVCKAKGKLFDVVDINKSCEEHRNVFLPVAGIPVYYALCDRCGFCWAPEMHAWPSSKFKELIYNDQYGQVDPDYQENRPKANSNALCTLFPALPDTVRHLDYGGGAGLLAKLLRRSKWKSFSYDPFVDTETDVLELGKFELITAFEVFEHVPDVRKLMENLRLLLADGGLVLFSTLLSDGNIRKGQRLNWWYASPRNGHISLFSRQSLAILARDHSFRFGSLYDGLHVFYQSAPSWASELNRMSSVFTE